MEDMETKTITAAQLQTQVDEALAALAADPVIHVTETELFDGTIQLDCPCHISGIEIVEGEASAIESLVAFRIDLDEASVGDLVEVWVDGFVNLWDEAGDCVGEIDLQGHGPIACHLKAA